VCGNLTVLGRLQPGESGALPPRVSALIESMLHVSQLRGAQSGGGAIKVGSDAAPRQAIVKCVKQKRGSLAERLTRELARASRQPGKARGFLVQTHVRFATSGPATRDESHPFRFVEAETRGPRRVFRIGVLEFEPTLRPIETAITHNGDLDALRFRAVRLAHPDLGLFLEHVLEAPYRWRGDSPGLAGIFELFLCQGMWFESLRLAYLEVIAPPPPDVTRLADAAAPPDRAAYVREELRAYPAPPTTLLARLAELAEEVWLSTAKSHKERFLERDKLAERLAQAFRNGAMPELTTPAAIAFARRSLDRFLHNDLFHAAREVEPALEGTFGCVITSTLEPATAVAFARGQPLSFGVQTSTGTVAIVSERNALRVRDADGAPLFDARFDFDFCSAEVARIAVGNQLQPQLSLHSQAHGRTFTHEELAVAGRLVNLLDNPLTSPLPEEPELRVDADLQAIPTIVRRVRADFADPRTLNRQTAEAFAGLLFAPQRPKLLIVGITNELWLAQQFALNLQQAFPTLAVEARSSNELLQTGLGPRHAGDAVVLAISQSGQDFPTLAALYQMRLHAAAHGHDGLFVLTGEADTLLGQAVGQSYARRAPWLARIFTNGGGYRPSEAATASVSATHATLCELLLFLCARALAMPDERHPLALTGREVRALYDRRDESVEANVPTILDRGDAREVSEIAAHIASQGRRWSWHLLEASLAFLAAGLVLQANLQWNMSLRPSGILHWIAEHSQGWLASSLRVAGTQFDIAFYLFLAPAAVWLLRLAQRRPLLHRQGTRELLIGDTAYVRNLVWLLARRLFSLSYGFASIKPYAADNQDELILVHEPVRGTIALFGIPDPRRAHLRGQHAAAMMTARQFASSRSIGGSGAEVLTVGQGPEVPSAGTHLPLPSGPIVHGSVALDRLMEGMFDSWERMLAMQSLLSHVAHAVAAFYPLRYDPSRTKDQVFAPTTASPVSGASFFGVGGLAKAAAARFSAVSLPFEVLVRNTRSSLLPRSSKPSPRRASRPASQPLPPEAARSTVPEVASAAQRPSSATPQPRPAIAPAADTSVAVLRSVPIGTRDDRRRMR
jgi:hypothetical protein